MTQDAVLLERYIQGGDREALEELFARHYAAVHRAILHMVHNGFDADDIAQATFLKAVRKSAGYAGRGSFRAWLLSIAVNEVRDFRRGHKRKREDFLFDLYQTADPNVDVPDIGMRREFEQKLEQALEVLPNELKDPLVLHYYEALSFGEVAGLLGVPKSTAATRVKNAIRQLRDSFETRGWAVLLPAFDELLPTRAADSATAVSTTGNVRRSAKAMRTTRHLDVFSLQNVVVVVALIVAGAASWWALTSGDGSQPVSRTRTAQEPSATSEALDADRDAPPTNTPERIGVDALGADSIVQGRVIDKVSGRGIGGATVRLYDYRDRVESDTVAAADGSFSFADTAGRRDAFCVIAESSGYGRELWDSVVPTAEPERLPLPIGARVFGRVLDVEGRPVRAYRIRALRRPSTTYGVWPAPQAMSGAVPQELRVDAEAQVTDVAGAFELTDLGAGPFELLVEIPGEAPWLHSGGDRGVVPTALSDDGVTIRLVAAADVRIHVKDRATGEPIDDAVVHDRPVIGWSHRFTTPLAPTGETGVYLLRRWLDGDLTAISPSGEVQKLSIDMGDLSVTAPGYAPALDWSEAYQFGDDYVYELSRGATVIGRVFSASDRPVPNSRVVVVYDDAPETMVVADRDGSFRVSGLVPEIEIETKIVAIDPTHRHRVSVVKLELEPGKERRVSLGGGSNGALVGVLRFRGEPLAEAHIEVDHGEDEWVMTYTDRDGRFRFDGLTPGPCTVEFRSKGHQSDPTIRHIWGTRRLHLSPDRTNRVDQDLRHELRGAVFDVENGEPVDGVEILARRLGIGDGVSIARSRTTADGGFVIMVAEPAAYQLEVDVSDGWVSPPLPAVDLTGDGPPAEIRIRVSRDPQDAVFHATIVDAATGELVAPARFELETKAMAMEGRASDGVIEWDEMRVGRYELRVHGDEHASESLGFEVLFGEKRVDRTIRLPRALSVWITESELGSPGHRAGLRVGDRIIAWGDHEVRSIGDLDRARSALGDTIAPLRFVRGATEIARPVSAHRDLELGLENRR